MVKAKKRRKPADERKEIELKIRLSTEHKQALQEAADRAGLGLSSWIRWAALQAAQESTRSGR